MRPPIPAPAYHERQKRRFGEIARALDGAEVDCAGHCGETVTEYGCDCAFASPDGVHCRRKMLQEIIAVQQHDPETEAAALADVEQYQLEIAKQEGS